MPELTKQEKEMLDELFGLKSTEQQTKSNGADDPAQKPAEAKKQPEPGSFEAIVNSIMY